MKRSIITALCLVLVAAQDVPEITVTVSKKLAQEGDNVTVTCRVDNLEGNPGDYVVIVYKSVVGNLVATPMDTNTDAYELIATNGFLTPLYKKPDTRYSIERDTDDDEKIITLDITRVTDEDSGYFGCMLAGDVLYATDVLEVIELPGQVSFTNLTTNLTMKEGQSATVQCRVEGALPEPHVKIYVGHDGAEWTDITRHFIKTMKTNINCPGTGGADTDKECMLSMDTNTNLTTQTFTPDFMNDYHYLKCEAHVPGTPMDQTVSHQVMLDLSYSPKFICQEVTETMVNATNVRMMCKARFNPQLTSANWTFQMNGREVTLTSDQTAEGITAREFKLEEGFGEERETEFSLEFARVEKRHFTRYTLTVANALGTNTTNLRLRETSTNPPDSAASMPAMSALIITISMILCLLSA